MPWGCPRPQPLPQPDPATKPEHPLGAGREGSGLGQALSLLTDDILSPRTQERGQEVTPAQHTLGTHRSGLGALGGARTALHPARGGGELAVEPQDEAREGKVVPATPP